MPVVPLKEILDRAFAERYGVAAFNVVNDLSLEAVIAAAEELRSPLIVQTSVKTVKSIGARMLYDMFRAVAEPASVPVTLHLDHCPDREVITTCLETGWNSVLFDGSALPVDENTRQTVEVVAEARPPRRPRRGRDRGRPGRRGRHRLRRGGRDLPDRRGRGLPRGHGGRLLRARHRDGARRLRGRAPATPERVTELVARAVPMVLHGGTGLSEEAFHDLIARGCAKVNISTALKVTYLDSTRAFLEANPTKYDPPSLFRAARRRQGDGRAAPEPPRVRAARAQACERR